MDEIVLKVNRKFFSGWTDISIKRSLSNLSGQFNLASTQRFSKDISKWEIRLGDPCSIEINKTTVLNGYIEDANIDYSSGSYRVEFSGRDKTCDLIDCPYLPLTGPTEFRGQAIISMIEKICSLFSITVKIDSDADLVNACNTKMSNESFVSDPGKTAFEHVVEMCKAKGILATSYGDGRLVLTRAGLNIQTGSNKSLIQAGGNVLQGTAEWTNKERFSHYTVKGQGMGNDEKSLDATAHPSTISPKIDKKIIRYRPFYKLIDSPDSKACNDYAKWELAYRAGMSRRYTYSVVEWSDSTGIPWQINKLVFVKDGELGVNRKLLINDVEFISGNNGSITKLSLVDPNTYRLSEPFINRFSGGLDPNPDEEVY